MTGKNRKDIKAGLRVMIVKKRRPTNWKTY